jgi:hypothetical protein
LYEEIAMPPTAQLAYGALDQLMRHVLTGCAQSARRAALLLERIEVSETTDEEMRVNCRRLRERLEDEHV